MGKVLHEENTSLNISDFFRGHRVLILLIASIILLCLPFISAFLWPVIFVFLIPLLFVIKDLKNYSSKAIIFTSWLIGLVFSGVVMAWILQTNPSSWTAFDGVSAMISKIAVWVLATLFVSFQFLLLGLALAYFKRRPTLIIVIMPAIWVLSEFFRVFAFAVFSYGPGGSFSPNWNLGLAGMPVTQAPIVYLSRFVGLYGLSGVAIFINTALFLLVTKKWKISLLMILPVFILSAVGFQVYQNPKAQEISVGAVHLDKDDNLDSWEGIQPPSADLDLLVLPEYSLFFENSNYDEFANSRLKKETLVVTSVSGPSVPAENRLTYYTPGKGIVNQQDKTFLVSGGEYMPYVMHGFFKVINQNYLVESFNESQQVKRGQEPEHLYDNGKFKVGGLVCSGVLALNEYRRLSQDGAKVLTNSASLSLISTARLFDVQSTYLTEFHAVSNARPFIQASRSSQSYILDMNGRRLVQAEGRSSSIQERVRLNNRSTVYSSVGEWVVAASFLSLAVAFFIRLNKLMVSRF